MTEEPDVWEIRLSGSERGRGTTMTKEEILWHRRESRRNGEDKPRPNVMGVPCLLEKSMKTRLA